MDETKTKIDNRWMYLWAAIDRHKRDSGCLSLSSKEWIGHTDIPQGMMKGCKNKPLVLKDRGP